MDQQRLDYLHKSYLGESLSPQEREEWEAALSNIEQEHPIKNLMDETWHAILPEERIAIDQERSDVLFNQIVEPPEARRVKLWPRILTVAAAVALIVTGVYFFTNNNLRVDTNSPVVMQSIAPGTMGATLTLANGKKIKLSEAVNGKFAEESGVTISKTASGEILYTIKADHQNANSGNQFNILSTARGETYQVRLPDGSLVYLNAASSLTYRASLMENGKRIVQLRGEGYFEISKDKAHPFIVKTDKGEVEVLGTQFNISSYADDEVEKTTLLEGSVKLTASGVSRLLKPGQQAKLHNGRINIVEADTDVAVAWKNNEFVVESERIENIMKMIERWYNVEVIYVGDQTNKRFSGAVSRFDKLSKVLEIVESTGAANFKIKGRKIYVSK